MIRFLYNNFRNMPGVGDAIKVAYIGSKVKDVLKDGKKSGSVGDLGSMAGSELEAELRKQASGMFDEFIMPEITSAGIPDQLVRPTKEKLINKMVRELRKQAESKIKEKTSKE